jgi:hypothetical protein
MLEAIDKAYFIGFPIDNLVQLEELSHGFSEHSSGIIEGCVMAIDGFGVQTWQPFDWEVEHPKDYWFCKGGFALIVLAGCDVKAQFVCATCTHSRSTNDIIAWQDCYLFEILDLVKRLPEKYLIIGDNAFNCTAQFLSPWPDKCFVVPLQHSLL